MNLPSLGVGVIYTPELEPLIEAEPELVTVVEVEPATLWLHDPAAETPYRFAPGALDRLRALPQAKLVHGVGFPVGGSRVPDPRGVRLFADTISTLGAPWASEHLAFNRAGAPGAEFNTGFLLPPAQTDLGVAAAVRSIDAVASAIPVPFAIETGVNYLHPRVEELSDGAFVGAVAEAADCGILLDLHNIWTNERNGRQSVDAFLERIPLDRVLEVHVAGGLERDGYWLDAHSGPVAAELLEIASRVLPRLPALRALIFEIGGGFVRWLGLAGVRDELVRLRAIWDRSAPGEPTPPVARRPQATPRPRPPGAATGPAAWEDRLGSLVVGLPPVDALGVELGTDGGVAILRDLVWDFRAGMIADVLKLTTRLLLLTEGRAGTEALLSEFFASSRPEPFASSEAEHFARFLLDPDRATPYLGDVVGFERASILALLSGQQQVVEFEHDPLPLLEAIGSGRLPTDIEAGRFRVEVVPDPALAAGIVGRPLTTT